MKNYKEDREFLEQYMDIIELSKGDKRIMVTPSLQGRVMSSSSNGDNGYSFGWINYNLISSGEVLPHCNNWGGEDRFWLGPEGGQFAIFFKDKKGFDFEDWQAPAFIDTAAWEIVDKGESSTKFITEESLENFSGTRLNIRLEREVEILDNAEISEILNCDIPKDLSAVGFTSSNKLTNIGKNAWTKENGALSIWILGQFKPSSDNQIIIPTRLSEGVGINDSYFGKIPTDRLQERNTIYYFTGDGNLRGKLGTPPEITIPSVFALDRVNSVLTVVKFSFEQEAREYINSMWEYQDEPYRGDVINSYNDGPLEDGTVMGGFYEIETSSKALFLSPEESHTHSSTTIHVKGELSALEKLLNMLQSSI